MATTRKSRPLLRQVLRQAMTRQASQYLRPAPLPAALAAIGFCTLFSIPLAAQAQQLPSGGSVISGSANIQNTSATQQVITQGSNKAIINWQGFSIGQGNSVQFVQPGTGSVMLNRVVGNDPSSIFGSLSANGQIFLVNPQGIYFSPSASLNVGGLVASTLNISNEDFLAGRYIFNRDPSSPANASVINEGLIRAREGGYVVLAGDYAANRGIVEARLGTVALAAGAKVTLDLQGDSLINLAVNEKTVSELAGVSNSGELNAEGGRVVMTAAVARDLAGTVVNNTGTVRATGTVEKDGAIYLVGSGGDVNAGGTLNVSGTRGGTANIQSSGTTLVSGTVDATGSAGRGGSVQVLGERAGIVDNARIDASGTTGGGTVLIGGDYQGKNPAVQNAQRTYVGADTMIKADATQNGDGGKVIVWADETARVHGKITARGGMQGGDGGFVETSGKKYLEATQAADVSAANGRGGTWMLDPESITITNATANVTPTGAGDPGPVNFAPAAADAVTTINVATINTALDSGSNVNITTASGGTTTSGDITVDAAIVKAADGGAADGSVLTMTADRDIVLNATGSITSTAGTLGVNLNAGRNINTQAAITSNGGDVTMASGPTGGITLGANINTATAVDDTSGAVTGGSLRLLAGTGGVTQTAGLIVADALGVDSVGPASFIIDPAPHDTATNNVNTLAANISGAGNSFSYADVGTPDGFTSTTENSLATGTVSASGAFTTGRTGVTTNGGDILLQVNGTLDANAAISTGGTAAGTATLKTTEGLAVVANVNLAANITANKVVIDAADAISQTAGGISATQLRVMAASGEADEAVTLTGNNNVSTLSAAKSTTATGSGGIYSFDFNNGGNTLTVGTVDAVSGITATSAGNVVGVSENSHVILTAGNLNISAPIVAAGTESGTVTLQPNTGTNASIGGAAAFDLTTAELNQVTASVLRIGNAAGAGSLAVGSAVANGTNWDTLILRAGSGGISQTQALTVTNLGVESTGNVTLANAGNDAAIFAADLLQTGSGSGQLQYTDSNGVTLGRVGLKNNNDPIPDVTVSGLLVNNNNATINTGGQITVDADIDVGTGVLTLNTTNGGAQQTIGNVITATGAGGVRLLGTGNFALGTINDNDNNIANIAANVSGEVNVRNAAGNSLDVDSVGGTVGITTNDSPVTLVADQMTFTQGINAGTGTVTLTAADTARTINIGTGVGGLDLTDAKLDSINATGGLTIGDNNHTGVISVAGTVNPNNIDGGITLRNRTGGIVINGTLQTSGATTKSVTLVADGAANAAGAITQGAGGGIVADTLNTRSSGGTTLNGSNNVVGAFTARETGGSNIELNNTGALIINGIQTGNEPGQTMQNVSVSTTGNLTVQVAINTQNPGDPGADPVVPPTPNAGSSVSLTSTTGSITLNQSVTAGSSGTVTLNAGGAGGTCAADAVCQLGGNLTGGNLLLLGTGNFDLLTTPGTPNNNFNTIAAAINGNLTYGDINALTVGSIAGTNGINTNGNLATLVANGALSLSPGNNIVATGSTIDLTASGISGGGAVIADLLAIRDSNTANTGVYALGGSVNGIAADINGVLSYADADALNVTSAGGLSGVQTRGGSVTLGSGTGGAAAGTNTITLLEKIDTRATPGAGTINTAGTVTLNANGGGVDQTSGSITANGLALLGSGTFALDSDPGLGGGTTVDNNVNILAAGDATSGLMNIAYRDINTVAVGNLGVATGINSRGGNVSIITENGNLTVNNVIDTRTNPGTPVDATNPTTSGGNITLEAAAPATADIVLNANMTGHMVLLKSPDRITAAPGVIVNATVNTADLGGEIWRGYGADRTLTNADDLSGDTVVIYTTNGADITQAADHSITANNLIFFSYEGNSIFNFTGGTNTVQNFAASSDFFNVFSTGSRAQVNLNTNGALNVTTLSPTKYYSGTANGIFSHDRNVNLSTNGALALTAPVNAGSGNVNLNVASGGISQTAAGAIIADTLGISSPNSVNLGVANNNIDTLGNAAINVNDALFSFRDTNGVTVAQTINVANNGAATVNITSGGVLTLPAAITATSTGNVAAANVTLRGNSGVNLFSPITATGGGASSGVNAGVNVASANGPITMFFGAGITATDNGPATAAGAAPHSAEVIMTSGSRSAWVASCAFNDICTTTVGNINATSNHGRAVIDVFGQGDAGDGVRVVGALSATGQTRPLISLNAKTEDSDGNELTSTGNINIGGTVTVNSTSSTAVNALADSVIGGIAVNGRNITVNSKLESRHADGVSRAQDGISINNVRQNININADIVTTSNGGIGITTGSNGTISGAGVIQAQNVNLVAPKSQGTFDVTTRIQPPAGIPGSGNLNVLGGRTTTIHNLSTETLIAALGFIDRSQDPPAPDLPTGDLTLKTAGTLQIATLDAYNTDFQNAFIPIRIELASDNFVVFPGTISTPGYAEITLRPYTDTKEIFVRNNADPSLPGVVYTTAPLLGLLQQFNPDAKLIIGGPNHKADITVGGDGLFTLGNMHLVFETGENGRVVRNFFSSDGNVYHPEPVNPYPGNVFFPYPGPAVSDGIGKLTSDKVQLIEKGNFQPSPGVTIKGACPAPCPGGSAGQGAITVSGDADTGGDGGGGDSGGGGGGSGGGGGTTTGGTDLGGPGATGTGTAADTGNSGGGDSPGPTDTTTAGGGSGGDPTTDTGGGVTADGGGTLSGPAGGSDTADTGPGDGTTSDGGGTLAGNGTDGTSDGTPGTTGDDTTGTTGSTPGGPSDPFDGGGSGGGTLAGDPGDGTSGTTSSGGDGGGTLADGSGSGGDGSSTGDGTGLAGGGSGSGDGTGTGSTGAGGDGSDTFGGGGSGGAGLAGDSSSGAGSDGLADGSGGGSGSDGATGGAALADGSGSGGSGGGSGGTGGSGSGDGSGLAGSGGDDVFGGGASGGGALAGDGGFSGAGGGSGSGGADGTGISGDSVAGGATGGGSLADGSTSGGDSSGLAGSGSGGGDGSTGGIGSDLAGGGSSSADGSGLSGDNNLAGGAGGSGLADGSGNASGSTGLAGDGFGSGGDGSAGNTGSGLAGSGSGLSDGGFSGGGSGSGSGVGDGTAGSNTGVAGSDNGLAGGQGGMLAGGESGSGGDGSAGNAGGSLAGSGSGLSDGGFSGGGSGSGAGDGTAGSNTSVAGSDNSLAGSQGGMLAGGGSEGSGFGDSSSGSAGSGAAGGSGGLSRDGSGGGSGNTTFAQETGSGDLPGAGASDGTTAGSGTGLAGELRGGASGGGISVDAGRADSRNPDGTSKENDLLARSGTSMDDGFRGGASGGSISVNAGRADSRNPDGTSKENDLLARSGTSMDGGFRGGASGGRAVTNSGEAQSRDPESKSRSPDNIARSGTSIDSGFHGGASGGKAAADAGESSGTDSRGQGKKDEERDRAFDEERDAQRIRLVGGNRLISVQGDGVNLFHGDRSEGAGTLEIPSR